MQADTQDRLLSLEQTQRVWLCWVGRVDSRGVFVLADLVCVGAQFHTSLCIGWSCAAIVPDEQRSSDHSLLGMFCLPIAHKKIHPNASLPRCNHHTTQIFLLLCLWNPNIALGRWLTEKILPRANK